MRELFNQIFWSAAGLGIILLLFAGCVVLSWLGKGLNWVECRIRGLPTEKRRPTYTLWLLENRNSGNDSLGLYIRHFKLQMKTSIDEPEEISDMRTRVAVLKECHLSLENDPYFVAAQHTVMEWDKEDPDTRKSIREALDRISKQKP